MTDQNKEQSIEEINLKSNNEEHLIEAKITDLEKKGDTEEQEGEHDFEEEKKDSTDYSSFSKEDFIKKANELIDAINIKEAHDTFKKIRILFDELIKSGRIVQIKEWADEGKEVREFKAPYDEQKDNFYKIYAKFLEKRAEEKKQAEEEKQKNLKAKQNLIEKLKDLSAIDETELVFGQVLDIQKEWRQIRTVPQQYMQELWDQYRLYIEKFYDNHSINNELKERDKIKNLEFKIDLLKKIDQLKEEKSIKKTHILLNKYHEEFRNIGPVQTKEASEDIWNRFKSASDEILSSRREQMETIKAKRTENLELKKLLCEKMDTLIDIPYDSVKIWKEKTEEVSSIFVEWKSIGPVPESSNDIIWRRFREAQNKFNATKKEFFDGLNKNREDNLQKKIALCEKAEKISTSTQFDVYSKELIALQEQWKSIGPVFESMNEKIWKRFRTACDVFFSNRNEFYKERNTEEKVNLELKEAVIAEVDALLLLEDASIVFEKLKALQQKWLNIGFVPFKIKQDLNQKYSKSVDALYKKFKQASEENKSLRMKDHFEMLASSPNGSEKLRQEEKLLMDKIRMLKENVETLNNNIGFFAKSKKADELKLQIEQKINISNSQITKLQDELKILKSLRTPVNK